MQASLVSARLVFALLIALFSAGNPPEEDQSVLVDRIADGAILGTYLATEEEGAVALVRIEDQGPPQAVAFLERLEGAAHLLAELKNERVYSLERFFAEEYTLAESDTTTMELPLYPEAMIADASRGSRDATSDTRGALSLDNGGEVATDAPPSATPTSTWRFVRSGQLLYIFPGEGEEIFVVRLVR